MAYKVSNVIISSEKFFSYLSSFVCLLSKSHIPVFLADLFVTKTQELVIKLADTDVTLMISCMQHYNDEQGTVLFIRIFVINI